MNRYLNNEKFKVFSKIYLRSLNDKNQNFIEKQSNSNFENFEQYESEENDLDLEEYVFQDGIKSVIYFCNIVLLTFGENNF